MENMNCRCTLNYQDTDMADYLVEDIDSFKEALNRIFGANSYEPKKILKSGAATIVFWADGTKTVIICSDGDSPNDYNAFTAALAIKVFGNNSHLKKVIRSKTVVQQPKKGKA